MGLGKEAEMEATHIETAVLQDMCDEMGNFARALHGVRRRFAWIIGLLVFIVILLSVLTYSSVAKADTFSPSRVKLLVHGTHEFSPEMNIAAHLIIPNLRTGTAPNVYLEFNWTPTPYITVTPCLGWHFGKDEVITSVRLAPKYQNFWSWVDLEFNPKTKSGYWFVQAEYKVLSWMNVGAEEESWGDFHKFSSFSHGGGPNVLLQLSKYVWVDLALHARELNQVVRLEFYLRFHVFFKD